MAALLRDALMPNLVQTLAGSPALVHGGPFANIAHGCNSVMATRLGLKLADVVVTEAGFGADLGAEKFLDIKCRAAGLWPSCAVVVATVRALKMHGGVAKSALGREDVGAVDRGVANLARHAENMRSFGLPVVVALNQFTGDTRGGSRRGAGRDGAVGVEVVPCTHWADGAAGAAATRRARCAARLGERPAPEPLYPDAMPLTDKIRTVARAIYRAGDVTIPPRRCSPARALRGGRLRQPAGLHRQNAIQFHCRPRGARRTGGPHPAGARCPADGRRGLRGGDLRRHHDDAGPAARPGGRSDQP